MLISIDPVPKPRMTRRDKWEQRPAVVRYRRFCDRLRANYPGALPETVCLVFYIPMPASWSAKKKAAHLGKPHQQKPDIDNLSKAVMDALAKDDSYIYVLHAEKLWADAGAIDIATVV